MLKGEVRPVSAITPAERSAMYELMRTFYENTEETVFLRDLSDKDYVLTLHDPDAGLVGFTTQKVLALEIGGRTVHGIFSGDTIIHKDFWGDVELFRVWAQFWFDYASRYDEFYWFLICKGYKTYRILPLFWTEFYPNYRMETPPEMQALIDGYAAALYPDDYDPAAGVIAYRHTKDRLRAGVADIGAKELRNRDTAFFCEKNPDWAAGNDLACIARIDKALLRRHAEAMLFET